MKRLILALFAILLVGCGHPGLPQDDQTKHEIIDHMADNFSDGDCSLFQVCAEGEE